MVSICQPSTPTVSNSDVDMTSHKDITSSVIECPHCEYRSTSSSAITQHSWEEHPLLMRRKKHLITSTPKTRDVKTVTGDERKNSSDVAYPGAVNELDMMKCSLASKNAENHAEFKSALKEELAVSHGEVFTRRLQLPTGGISASAPQRHIAVVKPVSAKPTLARTQTTLPIATYSHLAEVQAMQTMLQQQSIKFTNQHLINEQLMYTPLYNILIPPLNQYLTIPITANAQELSMESLLSQTKADNPVNGIQDGTMTSNQNPTSSQNQMSSLVYNQFQTRPEYFLPSRRTFQPTGIEQQAKETTAYKTSHRERVKQVNEVKPLPPSQKDIVRKNIFQSGIKQLLQSQMNHSKSPFEPTAKPTNQFMNADVTQYTSAKSESVCGEKGPFPSAKPKKFSQSPVMANHAMSLIGKERLQALQDAIRTTDCCEINNGSTMPFKCPDGVWRMVNFKCLCGVWVVQIPGSSTPTVFLPLDEEKMANNKSENLMEHLKNLQNQSTNRKRKTSHEDREPVEAKRLCASAPVPGLERHKLPRTDVKPMPMKRTLSNPNMLVCLSKNARHFTTDDGKKINISTIRRTTNSVPSCDLIRSLLLRKNGPHNVSSARVQSTILPKQNGVKNSRCQFAKTKFSYFSTNENTAKVSLAY